MPNWVKNRLSFNKRFNEIKQYIGEEDLDFNRIVPEPKNIIECPERYIRQVDDHVEKIDDRPWFNWYDWHCDNWGTKWNASEAIIGEDYIEFETAWSTPVPIFKALSEHFSDVQFTLDYADEDIGYNCGRIIFYNGDIDEMYERDEEFARNLWG